ncbi:hypothetical protein [Streptosporangium sp. NPDC049376]|uniref:hypothetical protein n=1 Tax=Streptosporangium sp. NPDC049376 TaxID=3366192 RepID=UPI0037BCD70B
MDEVMDSLRYEYADARAYLPDDGCVSWISGHTLDEVVRVLGGDPSSISPASFPEAEAEAWDLIDEDDGENDWVVMLAAQHQDWIVLLEIFHGHVPSRLRDVSVEGVALTVRWMLHRPVAVSYAEAGRVIADFDTGNLDSMTPQTGLQWLSNLPIEVTDWKDDGLVTALTLGERLSGVRIDRDWLGRRHLMVVCGNTPPPARAQPFEVPFKADDSLRPYLDTIPGLTAIARNPSFGHHHDLVKMVIDIALRYSPATTALETEALRLVESGIRNEHSRRLRDDLLVAADQVGDALRHAERSLFANRVRNGEPYRKPISPGDSDGDIYLTHVDHPAHVEQTRHLTLLRILRLALDEDRDSAQRAAEELPALRLEPEDMMKASLLRDLAYYIAHGKNV